MFSLPFWVSLSVWDDTGLSLRFINGCGMSGVSLGTALVVEGISQLSSEPNPRLQFHEECTDREVVIFHFDMKSAQSHVFRCRFLEAVFVRVGCQSITVKTISPIM